MSLDVFQIDVKATTISVTANSIDITVTSYSLNVSAQYSCTANIISFTASATFTLTSMGALNLQATLISMN